jgi:hypothetical protein
MYIYSGNLESEREKQKKEGNMNMAALMDWIKKDGQYRLRLADLEAITLTRNIARKEYEALRYIYIHMYTYICIYTYVSIFIYIHIYTYFDIRVYIHLGGRGWRCLWGALVLSL